VSYFYMGTARAFFGVFDRKRERGVCVGGAGLKRGLFRLLKAVYAGEKVRRKMYKHGTHLAPCPAKTMCVNL